jgi:hypothetical protein
MLLGVIVHAETFGSVHNHLSGSAGLAADQGSETLGQVEYAIPDPVHLHTERRECLVCLFHQQLFNSVAQSTFFVADRTVPEPRPYGEKLSRFTCSFTSKPIARLSGRAPPRGLNGFVVR